MHLNYMGYEQQYQLRDAGGNIVWQGNAIIGTALLIESTEASATISSGGAVIMDSTNTVLGRDQNPGTSDPDVNRLCGLQVAAAASVSFLGVATGNIPAGKRGVVAGTGSLCAVRTTAVAVVIGFGVIGSATVGLCATGGAKAAGVPTQGTMLGLCVKGGALIGSSGFWTCGVIVNQQ